MSIAVFHWLLLAFHVPHAPIVLQVTLVKESPKELCYSKCGPRASTPVSLLKLWTPSPQPGLLSQPPNMFLVYLHHSKVLRVQP